VRYNAGDRNREKNTRIAGKSDLGIRLDITRKDFEAKKVTRGGNHVLNQLMWRAGWEGKQEKSAPRGHGDSIDCEGQGEK